MADKRRLQGEIDRCLKKVQEGVDTFEDIWQKLHNAANTNQKDKYESDLKKEIKKLQRLRDQIKTWAASNEIKDKKNLLDNRKLIETQMERFKVVERETKTKAYSKEGLGLAAKIDPAQKEREETMQWLQHTIDKLGLQVEIFESRIESNSSHSRKKKIDGEKQKQNDEMKAHVERHKFHINKLETLMRMLDNQTITSERIMELQDDLEFYLEACEDPDYEENEFLYEDLNLDEALTATVVPATSPVEKHMNNSLTNSNSSKGDEDVKSLIDPTLSTSPVPNNGHSSSSSHNSKDDTDSRSRNRSGASDDILSPRKGSLTSYSSTANSSKPASRSHSTSTTPNKLNQKSTHVQAYAAAASGQPTQNQVHHSQTISDTHSNAVEHSGLGAVKNLNKSLQKSVEKSTTWQTPNNVVSSSISLTNLDVQSTVNSLLTSVASSGLGINGVVTAVPEEKSAPSSLDIVLVSKLTNDLSTTQPSKVPTPISLPEVQPSPHDNLVTSAFLNNNFNLKSIAEQAVVEAGLGQPEQTSSPFSQDSNLSINTSAPSKADLTSLSSSMQQQQSNLIRQIPNGSGETRMAPLLGVAPLGPVPLNKDNMYQQAMLEASWRHMPHPSDSERLRHYLPRNPCPTPAYYHQTPLPHHDSIDFYLRLSTETLFFIFYYMEATKAQYMAAKALKKQSWRFHTKYMMWFQRHEEPKTITDEYEQGTYIYFDYEKWGQRKKEGFTFEYRYLEDRELP
ncbi:CCR4-NOT transcription complex subunit 3-like [Styela clava]